MSAFHRLITTKLNTAIKAGTSTRNAAPFATQRPRNLTSLSSYPIDCQTEPAVNAARSSCGRALSVLEPLVISGLQPLPQIQHRVTLTRQQRAHGHIPTRGELLETRSLQLL